MTLFDKVALIRDCAFEGMIDGHAAVDVLVEACGGDIDVGEAAELLRDPSLAFETDADDGWRPLRKRDGRWSS